MTFSYLNMFGSVSPLHCLLLSPPTLTDHLPIPEDPSYFLSYLYLCPCVCVCVSQQIYLGLLQVCMLLQVTWVRA